MNTRSLKRRLDQRGRHYATETAMPIARRIAARGESWPGPQSKGPALWALHDPAEFPAPPIYGRFPQGFLEWALRTIRCNAGEVLHVCSGGLEPGQGARVDLRQDARPDVRADGCRLPFRDGCFPGVLIDPPYTVDYSRDLYGVAYPKPTALLAEAARVVRPCGRIGFLHFSVPFPPAATRIERIHGITTGCGYRIRAFTVFVRDQDELRFGGGSEPCEHPQEGT